jgi:hypothetical protein
VDILRGQSRNAIISPDDPMYELVKAVSNEFYENVPEDPKHYSNLFLSQRLCDISMRFEYKCVMKYLLYKIGNPSDPMYLRYYIASWPRIIPNLVRQRLQDLKIDIEDLSLAKLHLEIEKTLQDACKV